MFLLLFVNWGVEAFKWKIAISKIEDIPFRKAFGITLTAITASLVTPNRIGEVPVRALLLNKNMFKELTSRTVVASFSQFIITVLIGALAFGFVGEIFDFKINTIIIYLSSGVLSFIVLLMFFNSRGVKRLIYLIPYFSKNKIAESLDDFTFQDKLVLLLYSLLRYLVFSIQFYLVLLTFGVQLKGFYEIALIPVCFMITSIIPTLMLSEIGVRSSVAIIIFSVVSEESLPIVLASVVLWIINLAIPSVIGLVNLYKLKLIKQP